MGQLATYMIHTPSISNSFRKTATFMTTRSFEDVNAPIFTNLPKDYLKFCYLVLIDDIDFEVPRSQISSFYFNDLIISSFKAKIASSINAIKMKLLYKKYLQLECDAVVLVFIVVVHICFSLTSFCTMTSSSVQARSFED